MIRCAVLISAILAVANISAFSQAVPDPSPEPTPKPSTKRRTFDQFDLSSGIGSSSAVAATPAPSVIESVDQNTFDGIAQMVKHAASIESEYRSTDGVVIDPRDHFEPYRVLSRKLPALFRIMEMFRAGLLEQPVLTSPANVALLNQNQQVLAEMQMIVNSTEAQLARNQPKLLPIAERYGAPTNPVEKRTLVTAMFVRLNGNFTSLLGRVSVKK